MGNCVHVFLILMIALNLSRKWLLRSEVGLAFVVFLLKTLDLRLGSLQISFGSLVKIFIIKGNYYKETEFYFHFSEGHHSFRTVSSEFFVLIPLFFQINLNAFQKLFIIANKIFSLDVKTPLILHIFVRLDSKRLYILRQSKCNYLSFLELMLRCIMLRDDL